MNKFCGLTIKDVKASLGRGSQSSQINLQLVQDFQLGDIPNFPEVGWPCTFILGSMNFQGLLQKVEKNISTEGISLYSATIIDPREILDGTRLILSEYTGSTFGVYNLLNIYGWWESQGFGKSEANSAGIPYYKIASALQSLLTQPNYNAYGGPLNYKGVAYSLDLSRLPIPPAYYRISGTDISLSELIDQICTEYGCDYYVGLDGLVIRVYVINRNSPPFNTLPTIPGTIVRQDFGTEAKNEITSSFLIGGPKNTIHITNSIVSFWGYDIAGNPIIGRPFNHPNINGPNEGMDLNATGIEDIIRSPIYRTNTVEMRCALHSMEAWTAYVNAYKPHYAKLIPGVLRGPVFNKGLIKGQVDIVNDEQKEVAKLNNGAAVSDGTRMYNWVRSIAENYYGRQFLVRIPFVFAKQDDDTLRINYSSEPASSGYLPSGAGSLGISALNQEIIQDFDERILPYAYFNTLFGADTERVNWSESAVENNQMWTRVNQSSKIVFIPGIIPVPTIHIEMSAVYEKALDIHGDLDVFLRQLLKMDQADIQAIRNNELGGTFGVLGIHPAARYPTNVGIALKSNTEVYGPWYIGGAPGKVRFESDENLVPWEYGGYGNLNLVGQARVMSSLSNSQEEETGSITVVGLPGYNLGDALVPNGPNLTNIDIQYGTNGITTTYRFQTFTPRFGIFSRQNEQRIRTLVRKGLEYRRSIKQILNRALVANQVINNIPAKKIVPKHLKKESPHTVVMSRAYPINNNVRVTVGTETYESALTLSRPTDNDANNMAVMSWSGLVRPFSTNPQDATTSLPKCGVINPALSVITRNQLNPFNSGHDIEVITSGLQYTGMNAWQRGSDTNSTRAIGLRGPLWVTGFGPGAEGNGAAYPYGGPNQYHPQVLRNSSLWKTGPVDLLWDEKRGVWTSHDLLTAITAGAIPANGSNFCNVGGNASWQIVVFNHFSVAIPANRKVIIGYCVNMHNWYVIAADCV